MTRDPGRVILNLVPGALELANSPGKISYRHPSYEERWWWREFYRISYLGGREYLKPTRLTVEFQEPLLITRTADGQLPSSVAGPGDYTTGVINIPSVLFRHNREKAWEFENRRKRSHYINFIQPIVKSLVSHATKKAATREGSDDLKTFWKGVNYERNEPIQVFMRDGLRWAAVKGVMWACVDQKPIDPKKDPGEPGNDGKPYVYWVSPLDILDWGIDDDGCVEWLKQFVYTEQKRTWKDKITPVYRFRIWTATDVTTYEVTAGGAETVVARRTHGAGRVPFVPLFSQRDKESVFPDGIPIMADACKLANAVYNYSSLKDEIGYKQTFSWLAIPDKNVDTVQIGLNTAFGYDPMHTGALPVYISPDPNQARVLMDFIANGLEQLRQMLGVGRGRSEGSMQKQSADALELENEDKRSILGDIASEAQSFERRLVEMVEAYGGGPGLTKTETRIEYADDFDLKSFSDEVNEYLLFAQIGLSPEVKLQAKQDLVRKHFVDLPADEAQALVDSMEAQQKVDLANEAAMKAAGTANVVDNNGQQGHVTGPVGNTQANQPPNAGPRQPRPPQNAGAATGAAEPGTR